MSRALLALLLLLGATGCHLGSMQFVESAHREHRLDQIDAQWWLREINSPRGQLMAIELVYCPLQPGTPTVCRTAVVWESGKSSLVPSAQP